MCALATTAPHPMPPAARRRLTLVLGALAGLGPLSIDMYLPSFPSIAAGLDTTVARVELTLAAYLAGLAVGQLAYGPLSDRFGRRPPLLGGLALYALASLACAAAPSVALLAAARLLQALGGCAGMVISRAVVRDHFDAAESARLYSSLMLVMGVAPVLAPLVGGQVVGLAGWRAIFLLLAALGVAAAALIALGLPESLPLAARHRAGAREALRAFAVPLRDLRFVRLAVASGAIQASMFAYIAGAPFVLIELFGVAPQRFGLYFGSNAAGLIAASQANRVLVRRTGLLPALRAATAVACCGAVALSVAVRSGAGLALVAPALFVCVASVGVVLPNGTAAAMERYGQRAGSASSVLGVLQSSCGAVAATCVSALADGTARPMANVMLACGVAALVLLRGVRRAGSPGVVTPAAR